MTARYFMTTTFDGVIIMTQSEAHPTPTINPNKFRKRVDYETLAQTTKKIDLIPVIKPSDTDFIRVHPDDNFAYYDVPMFTDKKDRGRLYYIDDTEPDLIPAMSEHLRQYNLYYYVTSTGDIGLWPVVLPKDGDFDKWNVNPRTATALAETAKTQWIQLHHADNETGYYTKAPRDDLGEPEFPNLGAGPDESQRVLELGFKGYIISDFSHALVKKCLGLK
jgi:hypothetical protein